MKINDDILWHCSPITTGGQVAITLTWCHQPRLCRSRPCWRKVSPGCGWTTLPCVDLQVRVWGMTTVLCFTRINHKDSYISSIFLFFPYGVKVISFLALSLRFVLSFINKKEILLFFQVTSRDTYGDPASWRLSWRSWQSQQFCPQFWLQWCPPMQCGFVPYSSLPSQRSQPTPMHEKWENN